MVKVNMIQYILNILLFIAPLHILSVVRLAVG